jgi:hypothetical protein
MDQTKNELEEQPHVICVDGPEDRQGVWPFSAKVIANAGLEVGQEVSNDTVLSLQFETLKDVMSQARKLKQNG